MTKLSILIPHKRNPANDRALSIALSCLVDNTDVDYELIIDAETPADPYVLLNSMAQRARSEYVLFANSDLFVAPNWARPMLDAARPDWIITGVLVEPGAIGVHVLNHHRNFGMLPETFDRIAFERWCIEAPECPQGEGWYFPSLHHREAFLDFGGFDTELGAFPEPLDAIYWDRWRLTGRKVHRVMSFAYHLQKFSSEVEQQKAVRWE